jgi:iron complex transport system substrate-binding protein
MLFDLIYHYTYYVSIAVNHTVCKKPNIKRCSMKRTRRLLILHAAFALAFTMLAGCAGEPGTPISQGHPDVTAQSPESSAAAPEQQSLAPPSAQDGSATSREITDMAGRTMTVPAEIVTIFSANAVAAIYLYTLVPDMLLGWNYELNIIERSIILEQYHSLPNFGMGDAVNYEAVIAAFPSIALNVSAINAGTIDQSDIMAERLGVPVVMVSDFLGDAAEVYRFLGSLFGVEDRAEMLAEYAERTFADIAGMTIPESERISIYFGNGEDSLETAPAGSWHGQVIDMINAINVADLGAGEGSRIRISAEQLLAWDPDVIIVNGEPRADMSGSAAAGNVINNPNYATLGAVRNNMVFGIPNAPFSWVDRPPGPNRIVGMRWLAKMIYPDYLDYDVNDEIREFFRLFYHRELTDGQLGAILSGAVYGS